MSRLSTLFAKRYLFSKKSHSVINIISVVSSFTVAIPVMAMVILLSVFNGFDGLVKSMYKSFDPDIVVKPLKGKVFNVDSISRNKLLSINGVEQLSFTLEENAMFEYRDRQHIGVILGVDSLYNETVVMDTLTANGEFRLYSGDIQEATVGQGVAYTLGIRTNFYDPLTIYTPRRGRVSSLLPYGLIKKQNIFPSNIFTLDAETDSKYVIVPLEFAQELLDYQNKISAIAVRITPTADPIRVQQALISTLGPDYKVLTRYQQKESLYRIMMYEKWGVYFIISLVLIIASFSLVGSLVMLIIDKRKDMQTLLTMGGDVKLIRKIFITEGMLVYLIGSFCGMILGVAISLAQQHYGMLKLTAQTLLIDVYPVEIRGNDLLLIALTFTAMSYIISKLTVIAMIPRKQIRMN